MPPKLEQKVKELFKMIDIDDSKIIDREETLKFWYKGFGKLNSKCSKSLLKTFKIGNSYKKLSKTI